ncbi:hypothetical protein Tco_0942401 [Tanacetum coccineum]
MSDMAVCLDDLSYIPSKNEQNKPTQGDIGETKFMAKFSHLKDRGKWISSSFNDMLEFLHEAFPTRGKVAKICSFVQSLKRVDGKTRT